MSHWKVIGFATLAAACLSSAPVTAAQISINIGAAPVCPYGYFDYAPYDCAPYGYYGPDWFVGGVFIGAGPWFHRPAGWVGHVTTATTRVMAIMDPCRSAGRRPLTISRPMKRATGMAT